LERYCTVNSIQGVSLLTLGGLGAVVVVVLVVLWLNRRKRND